ncbi:hypothetical protein [Azospirillum sp. BE72]|uniref:hypothetical protein n=1 Tax=Azospirillum sp. BE72 TaxID=2817776 RepID=UPI00285D8F6E|nr:hypothetical protein [Azospirillum sp. BE72]MDR6769349.1 hypothetical protein [Azospirillum sp. BE72]
MNYRNLRSVIMAPPKARRYSPTRNGPDGTPFFQPITDELEAAIDRLQIAGRLYGDMTPPGYMDIR